MHCDCWRRWAEGQLDSTLRRLSCRTDLPWRERKWKQWADPQGRMDVARAMYGSRFGEIVRTREIEVLRGQEGARIKRSYQLSAQRWCVDWRGRNHDRENPEVSDLANQSINHAATAMSAAASAAVAAFGAIPQLGFVHEDLGQSFVLDVADLYRHDVVLHIAFGGSDETRRADRTADPPKGGKAHTSTLDYSLYDRADQDAAGSRVRVSGSAARGQLMSMAVVITRDVEARYRGFLASVMLELAPGVYAHPRISAGVRAGIWSVLSDWHGQLRRGSIVLTWGESAANGGLGMLLSANLQERSSPQCDPFSASSFVSARKGR